MQRSLRLPRVGSLFCVNVGFVKFFVDICTAKYKPNISSPHIV
nr:MAG TPA: hypothetical protein [Caudoviricetes sp.]